MSAPSRAGAPANRMARALAAGFVVAASLGTVVWGAHAAVDAGRRALLLEESAAAARTLRGGGVARLATLLPGRWAQSAIVQPDLDEARISGTPDGWVGRAPVVDAAGDRVGTVAVLESRDVLRAPPAATTWAPAFAAIGLLGLSLAAGAGPGRVRAVVAICGVLLVVVPAWRAVHWTGGVVDAFETRRAAVAREAASRDAEWAASEADARRMSSSVAITSLAAIVATCGAVFWAIALMRPGPRRGVT